MNWDAEMRWRSGIPVWEDCHGACVETRFTLSL
jgi:hypothetical protein